MWAAGDEPVFEDTIKLGYIHGVTHQNLICHFLQCVFATKLKKKKNYYWSVLRLFTKAVLTDQNECFNPKSVHVPWTTSTNLADLTMGASVLRFYLKTQSNWGTYMVSHTKTLFATSCNVHLQQKLKK